MVQLRAGKFWRRRDRAVGKLADQRAAAGRISVGEPAVRRRIDDVDAGAHHCDGDAASVERARWAAASIPRARPLTTTTPAGRGRCASCSATASPYGDGRREPTIATRGPVGGGHRPRALSAGVSGGDIVEPVAERLQDVALADRSPPSRSAEVRATRQAR